MKQALNQHLFWDVDVRSIDFNTSKAFVIKRILTKGDLDDLRWALDFYGKDSIKEIFLCHNGTMDPKSINFFCTYFNLDKSICTQRQSTKKQSAFWKR